MTTLMTPIRDEHRELLPEIGALRETADMVGSVSSTVLSPFIASRIEFLRDRLRPHAQAEDAVLYPLVARLLGGPEATATMQHDHVEVVRLTDELQRLHTRLDADPPDEQVVNDLRAVLYGLFAVVSLHFAKEEQVYVPLLERGLSPEAAEAMFNDMHTAHERLAHQD